MFKRMIAGLTAAAVLASVSTAVMAARNETPSGIPIDEVGSRIEQWASENENEYPSFAVAVVNGGDLVYSGAFGYIDIGNGIEATPDDTVYEWGSCSKTLVWVSVMQLWEQGKLDLDKDVREYLPDGFFQHLSYDEPITMMNLMNHNAGWQETTRPIEVKNENEVLPLKEALQAIEPVQINPPNKTMAYSNYGAAVAGYVVECVSGMDFCDYVHENILEPLGMEHTAINPTHSDNDYVCEQRKKTRSYKTGMQTVDLGNRLNYISAYPAGAATGTLSDLMTYAQAFVDDDAPLFENPETQKFMFEGTSFYGDSDIPICCHGFWCDEYAVRTYGHNGATNAGQANMTFDPESKTGLVILINEPQGNEFMNDVPYMVFGELATDKYNFGKNEKINFSGYYLSSRSTYSGMLKFFPYITALSSDVIADTYDIGNNVYQMISNGHFESKNKRGELFGNKIYPDGTESLQSVSEEYIKDKFYVPKLLLITLYLLLALMALYMIRIRHKLKRFGKWEKFSGANAILAGQISQILSVIFFFIMFMIAYEGQSGLTKQTETVMGILQIICAAVMGISTIYAVISMLPQNKKFYHIMQISGNIVSVLAIVYFEMYKFEI